MAIDLTQPPFHDYQFRDGDRRLWGVFRADSGYLGRNTRPSECSLIFMSEDGDSASFLGTKVTHERTNCRTTRYAGC